MNSSQNYKLLCSRIERETEVEKKTRIMEIEKVVRTAWCDADFDANTLTTLMQSSGIGPWSTYNRLLIVMYCSITTDRAFPHSLAELFWLDGFDL